MYVILLTDWPEWIRWNLSDVFVFFLYKWIIGSKVGHINLRRIIELRLQSCSQFPELSIIALPVWVSLIIGINYLSTLCAKSPFPLFQGVGLIHIWSRHSGVGSVTSLCNASLLFDSHTPSIDDSVPNVCLNKVLNVIQDHLFSFE